MSAEEQLRTVRVHLRVAEAPHDLPEQHRMERGVQLVDDQKATGGENRDDPDRQAQEMACPVGLVLEGDGRPSAIREHVVEFHHGESVAQHVGNGL